MQEPYLATYFSALLLLASYDVDHFGVAQVRRIAAEIAWRVHGRIKCRDLNMAGFLNQNTPWPTTVYDRPRLVAVAWSKSRYDDQFIKLGHALGIIAGANESRHSVMLRSLK